MQNKEVKVTRRKLVGWLGILTAFGAAGAAVVPWKSKKPVMVKMLTQDGKLVEVDARVLENAGAKISDCELQGWLKKDDII